MACEETPSGLIVGTGTLQQWGGECGDTWLLSADSGRRYELTSLPAEFQEQDLRVRFTLRPRADVASTCMVGAAADVVSMAKL
jgi:hypothetical protein